MGRSRLHRSICDPVMNTVSTNMAAVPETMGVYV